METSRLELAGIVLAKAANLFHIHGGKVTRLALYWDRARALANFGLEE